MRTYLYVSAENVARRDPPVCQDLKAKAQWAIIKMQFVIHDREHLDRYEYVNNFSDSSRNAGESFFPRSHCYRQSNFQLSNY